MQQEFIVVENAGYQGENDVSFGHKSYDEAAAWMSAHYSDLETEILRVDICVEIDGHRTYEYY